jgi:hypothetical protein
MKIASITIAAALLPSLCHCALAQDYQAYYENTQRLSSPHSVEHLPWPVFAKNDHTPHIDAWGRDLNGPPFRNSCDGMYYGTGYHGCGTLTGGPVGGLPNGN